MVYEQCVQPINIFWGIFFIVILFVVITLEIIKTSLINKILKELQKGEQE